MIRIRCPHCQEALKAPPSLAGKKGRCPACRGVVPIAAEVARAAHAGPVASLGADNNNTATNEAEGLTLSVPESLRRNCHYLICNSREIVARWDDDGKGWMVRIKDGFVKAIQNPKQIPSMGNYIFIEIEITNTGVRQQLTGVHGFSLLSDFVLNKLTKKNENTILEGVAGTAELNDRQRALVRQQINAKYLPNIWEDAIDF